MFENWIFSNWKYTHGFAGHYPNRLIEAIQSRSQSDEVYPHYLLALSDVATRYTAFPASLPYLHPK